MSSKMTISAASPFAGTVINVTDHGASGDDSADDWHRQLPSQRFSSFRAGLMLWLLRRKLVGSQAAFSATSRS